MKQVQRRNTKNLENVEWHTTPMGYDDAYDAYIACQRNPNHIRIK